VDKVPLEQPAAGPSKRPRSRKNSTSLSPPQPLGKQNLPRSKHTLSGHSLLNEAPPIANSSTSSAQTLPSTGSFAVRRAALSNSRKGAPSSLSINPSTQSSKRAKELGLEPAVRSAPPVPASRLRLHQLQSASQPHVFQQSTSGGVQSISRVRFGATYETSPVLSKVPQPPKTAGLMGSSSHTSGGGGIQTILQPPTPSTAGIQSRVRDYNPVPLVPPTPSSLRHTLNQTHPPRQTHTQSNAAPSTEGRVTSQSLQQIPKQAFMQPFEAFYDALSDVRALKDWLSDQLQRASALVQQQQQQIVGSSINARAVEEMIDHRLKDYRTEMDQLRERVSVLEGALVRSGIAIPPASTGGLSPSSNLLRPNGNTLQKSPRNKRDRELPLPSTSGNHLRDSFSQNLRPASLSPSAQQTTLPPASSLTKLSTSSSRHDSLPPSAPIPPVARSSRVPSPLGGSPIGDGEERRENRKSQDREDRMDTT
jgi:hypothetical protein